MTATAAHSAPSGSPPPPTVLALLGPTAAGKSALGVALATQLGGEIVSCDSLQVYRGMDVGTGKATPAERAAVPHHLLDVVAPDQPFDAAAWARLAAEAVDAIAARGQVPLIVGGTGLYFRALARGLFEAPPADPALRARHRAEAEAHGVESLHRRLAAVDPEAAARIRAGDLLRISRALEVFEQTGTPMTALWARQTAAPSLRAFTVVLAPPLPVLRLRVDARVDAMVRGGFLDEVRRLRATYGPQPRPFAALGYKQLGAFLDGDGDEAAAVAATKAATVAYARRQRTWFKKEAADLILDGGDHPPAAAAAIAAAFRRWRATPPRSGTAPSRPSPSAETAGPALAEGVVS